MNMAEGLNTSEVSKRLEKFGYNEIVSKSEFKAFKVFISQFTNFLIIILIFAGAISIFLHEKVDGIAIFTIVIMNAIIGFIQEYKAENAVSALKKLVIPVVVVVREGVKTEVPVRDLVPDDIVILSEGDKIPADMVLLEAFSLQVDEAILTGESLPVHKEMNQQVFKGTLITTGRGMGQVKSTGMATEFGKIVGLLSNQPKTKSPLTLQIEELGKKIGIIVFVLVSILFILGSLREVSPLDMLMTSVSLGVSAIPEGMPIIITLTLAIGVQALAKKQAIVRKMNSIETLGATTVICSDKTGTLTLNEMTVTKVNTNFTEKDIKGVGYNFKDKTRLTTPEQKKLLEICENCNNSTVSKNILGDPTEIALKILTRKAGYNEIFRTIDENTFSSERKMMSTLHEIKGKKEIFAKGAFEEIIKRCAYVLKDNKVVKFSDKERQKYCDIALDYSKQALRVLGFAYKNYEGKFDEENLIFVGLVGMIDPPRSTVKQSMQIAQKAGIKVKIITGDNPITAKAIGEKIGLKINNVATGEDVDNATDEELKLLIARTEIFARTKPQHKYRIVDILKKQGEVVAVTGDGVNDAPAIKHGDVGIAMGIKGTEATKEVADIILKDDNFSTIITTVKEGRRTYKNILSFIKYMLSANFITIVLVGILTIFGYPLPILPLQILWINLATDALPALALGNSPAGPNLMNEKPRVKDENVFKKFFRFIFIAMLLQVVVNLLLYFYGMGSDANIGYARTLVLTQTVLFELFFAFVCKEEKSVSWKSLGSNKSLIIAVIISFALQLILLYVPFMQGVFKTMPLDALGWLMVFVGAMSAFLVPHVTEFSKNIFKPKS